MRTSGQFSFNVNKVENYIDADRKGQTNGEAPNGNEIYLD